MLYIVISIIRHGILLFAGKYVHTYPNRFPHRLAKTKRTGFP